MLENQIKTEGIQHALKQTHGYQGKPNKGFKWLYCIKSFFKSFHLLTFDNKITSIYSMLVT